MGFIVYDIAFLVIFSMLVLGFLIPRRKRLKKEGILFLYRTKIGLRLIDYIGRKHKSLLRVVSLIILGVGYILMITMLYFLGKMVYIFLRFPEIVKVIKVPPIMPLIPYLPSIFKIDFLPPFYFTYWILAIAITAVVHEFFHGIFMKLNNVKIKSTGFAFLGPFLAFFVEQDEKSMEKIKNKDQRVILAAGSFSNVLISVIFFFLLWLFFILSFTASGMMFNMYAFGFVNSSDINVIGGSGLIVDFDGGLNLSEIVVNNQTYFIERDLLDGLGKENVEVFVYEDRPALRAGLKGAIISLNDVKIKNYDDFIKEMLKYKPGDIVKIETVFNDEIEEYEIKLDSMPGPGNEEVPYLGITLIKAESFGILNKIKSKIMFFKKENIYYAPKGNGDFMIFIYNLIWWILIINISVALVNMLPLGIFDGGRFFYLTILSLTKSKKIAKKSFYFMTYLLLFLLLVITLVWFLNFK